MGVPLWVFCLSLAACGYLYAGYPVLVFLLARIRPRPVRRAPVHPAVSIVIPAFNEEAVIERKIRNTLALDYPRDLLDIIVVSDGSTDRTEEVVRRHEGPRLRLLVQPRVGKVPALNRGARAATGEVLVLTDADTLLERDALLRLVESFADPAVGGVSGTRRYRTAAVGDGTGTGEAMYWRFDTWQKRCESRIGSIFAAAGSLYALRRNLYTPIADPAQADDIAISTRVVLQGYRLVFEPRAVAIEEAPVDGAREFRRKVRITNHSLRALLNLRARLWTSGFYSVQLLSHKFFRHFSPVFLLALLASSTALATAHAIFRPVLAVQLVVYGLGAAGFALRARPGWPGRLLTLPAYFCVANLAALLGILAVLRGRRLRLWMPRGGADAHPEAAAGTPARAKDGVRGTGVALVALLLGATGVGAQDATPSRPPETRRPGPQLSVALTLASIFDTNLDYVSDALPSYGALAGFDARFQSRPYRQAVTLEYAAAIQSYSRTDKWDRVSHRGRATLSGHLGSNWTLDAVGEFSLLGATEDRELVDDMTFGPRLEFRHDANRMRVSAARRIRRNRGSEGADATNTYGAIDVRGRLAGTHDFGLSYRYEISDAADPRRGYVESLYGGLYSASVGVRGTATLGVRYRSQHYPERTIRIEDRESPRQDRTWQPSLSWMENFAPGPQLRLDYRYEARSSNIEWANFDGHYVSLSLRQPLNLTGASRPTPPVRTPTPAVPVRPRFTQTIAGGLQTCALTTEGMAHCWPTGDDAANAAGARPISEQVRFSTLSVGAAQACGLTVNGIAYCWGSADATPRAIRTSVRFASIAVGARHVCGLTPDGRAYCWGDTREVGAGSGIWMENSQPAAIAGDLVFTALAAGWDHTCGLTYEGAAHCWGSNRHGQLGALFIRSTDRPRPVTGGIRFAALAAGRDHTCGLAADGTAYCWGANAWGQLGNGSVTDSRSLVPVAGGLAFTTISAGWEYTCGVATDGTAYCWGRNDRGQLGHTATDAASPSPRPVAEAAGFLAISASERTCGITRDGEVRCWGASRAERRER